MQTSTPTSPSTLGSLIFAVQNGARGEWVGRSQPCFLRDSTATSPGREKIRGRLVECTVRRCGPHDSHFSCSMAAKEEDKRKIVATHLSASAFTAEGL